MTEHLATTTRLRCCWAAASRSAMTSRRQARRNCASASSRRRPASSPRSARTWSTASRCISTRSRATSAAPKVKFIVEDEQAKPDTAVTKAKKLILQDKVHMFVGGLLASTRLRARAGQHRRKDGLHRLGPGGRRSHPARPAEISLLRPHRLDELAAEPSVRTMGLRAGLQEDRRDRRRLRLRLRGGRRLPARVRGLRRPDHPEDLAAARHQGLRALHPDHQGGCGRDLHAHGRADVAAVPQAAGGVRQQEAGDRRRHEL